MYNRTQAYRKICQLNKRIRGIGGGSSASKTVSILIWLIAYCQKNQGKIVSVVSWTLPHLKKGAIRDFLSIMSSPDDDGASFFRDSRWNKTDFIYTFETGSKLEFFSVDQPGKVRGPRRDVLFVNEANNINYETYTQLEIRTRDIVFLDWNPISEFWWYSEVMNKPSVDSLVLTYKDNEALSENEKNALEARMSNKSWWKVYGLGQLGEIETAIYKNWKIIDEIPHEARLERYGLDFGYTNDPSSIVAIYYYNGGYILDEICYQKGLSNKQLSDILTNLPQALIIADSAEPKSIDELKLYGLNILPANKGVGSVNQGIQFVQSKKVSITKGSVNGIKEYRNYVWQTDKNGKILQVPDHQFSHFMDAVRYGFTSLNPELTARVQEAQRQRFDEMKARIAQDSSR